MSRLTHWALKHSDSNGVKENYLRAFFLKCHHLKFWILIQRKLISLLHIQVLNSLTLLAVKGAHLSFIYFCFLKIAIQEPPHLFTQKHPVSYNPLVLPFWKHPNSASQSKSLQSLIPQKHCCFYLSELTQF